MEVDAAEALANFARQSTNVSGAVYSATNGFSAEGVDQVSTFTGGGQTLSPKISIQPTFVQEQHSDREKTEELDHDQEAPNSPRLKPIPSDSLPLVSPFLAHKASPFSPHQDTHEAEQDGILSHPSIASSNHSLNPALIGEEDLYSASPLGHQEQPSELHDTNDVHNLNGEELYPSEDQWGQWQSGQWQSVESHISHPEWPPRAQHLSANEDLQMHAHDLLPIEGHLPKNHYPELEESADNIMVSNLGHIHSSISYPELPDVNDDNENQPALLNTRHLSSHASRSVSVVSQTIDLTESDDEDVEGLIESSIGEHDHQDQRLHGGHDSRVSTEREVDQGDDEKDEEEYNDEEENTLATHWHSSQNTPGTEEDVEILKGDANGYEAEGYEDEEEFDDEKDEIGSFNGFEQDQNEGTDIVEEEESYDEENSEDDIESDEEQAQPVAQKEPVVIDLLSSDDEDEGQDIPKSAASPVSRPQEGYKYDGYADIGSGEEIREGRITEERVMRAHLVHEENFHEEEASTFDSDGNEIPSDEEQDEEQDEGQDEDEEDVTVRRMQGQNPDDERIDENDEEAVQKGDNNEPGPEPQLVDEEMNDISENEDTLQTSQHDEPISTTPLGTPSTLMKSSQFAKLPNSTSPRSSYYSHSWGIDGANDDYEPKFASLRASQKSPPAASENYEEVIEEVIEETYIEHQEQLNLQLPTPDDTQQSGNVISAETSFTSVTSHLSLGEVTEEQKEPLASEAGTPEHVASEVEVGELKVQPEEKVMRDIEYVNIDDTLESFEARKVTQSTGTIKTEEGFEQKVSLELEEPRLEDMDTLLQMEIAEDNKSTASSPEDVTDTLEHIEVDEEMTDVVEPQINHDNDLVKDREGITISTEPIMSEGEDGEKNDLANNAITNPVEPATSEVASGDGLITKSIEPALSGGEEGDRDSVEINKLTTKSIESSSRINKNLTIDDFSLADFPPDAVERAWSFFKTSSPLPLTLSRPSSRHGTEPLKESSEPSSGKSVELLREKKRVDHAGTLAKELAAVERGGEVEQSTEHENSYAEGTDAPKGRRRSSRTSKPTKILDKNTISSPTTPAKSLRSAGHTRSKSHSSVGPKSKEEWEPSSPMIAQNSKITAKGHDASIELALSSADSPPKSPHNLRKQPHAPVSDPKVRLITALRTELSQFTSLKVLRYHLNKTLDVLGVVTTSPPEPERAKGGPRHYLVSFNITDPSIAPAGVTEVQVFRPYKEALPTVKIGDGILLREFQVISVKNRGFALRSDEGSGWVVFKSGEDGGVEVEVRGPPVEYGEGETKHIEGLKQWFKGLDETARSKIERANGDKSKGKEKE